MDEDLEDGERILPTALDLAAMEDIGWTPVGTVPPPPPPPAAPRPPVAPPAPIPAGRTLHAVGTGEGTAAQFTLNDAATFTQLASFVPYPGYGQESEFTGGVRAVTADINQDGVEDVIVGPGPGIPTEIKVFSGANFPVSPGTSLLASGYAFEAVVHRRGVRGGRGRERGRVPGPGRHPGRGRRAAGPGLQREGLRPVSPTSSGSTTRTSAAGPGPRSGDVNGDGTGDLLVAAGFGGGPRVAVFDGQSLAAGQTPAKLFADFFVFEQDAAERRVRGRRGRGRGRVRRPDRRRRPGRRAAGVRPLRVRP